MADTDPDAAILLMLLAEEQAAQIVGELSPGEIETLGKSMVALTDVEADAAESALNRFVASAQAQTGLRVDGTARARTVLSQALGSGPGDAVMARIAPVAPRAQVAALAWMHDEDVLAVIEAEHPQIGAFILTDLDPRRAAALVLKLAPSDQEILVRRMARLGPVDARWMACLGQHLSARAPSVVAPVSDRSARVSATAAVLASMPKPADQALLRAIAKRDKMLAQEISDEMFVFADVLKLDAKSLSAVVRAVDAPILVLAMRSLNMSERDKLLAGLSARAADAIRDELAEAQPAALAEVEAAQKAIVAIVRRMEGEGSLQLGGGAATYV